MKHKGHLLGLTIAAATFLAGCKTHSTDASLYSFGNDEETYLAMSSTGIPIPKGYEEQSVPAASNAIFVPKGHLIGIDFEEINPGWIHESIQKGDMQPIDHNGFDSYGYNRARLNYLKDKSLWMLTTIKTMSNEDSLEMNTKKVFLTSCLKYGSGSFGSIPLDLDEKSFRLDSTSVMNVEIRIYEVKGVGLKRNGLSVWNDNPGIAGTLDAAFKTTTGSIGSIILGSTYNQFKKEYGEDRMAERALLEMGAVLQFRGEFVINRNETQAEDTTRDYILVDELKAELTKRAITENTSPDLDAKSPKEYVKLKSDLFNSVRDSYSDRTSRRAIPFIKFRVDTQWDKNNPMPIPAAAPNPPAAASGATTPPENASGPETGEERPKAAAGQEEVARLTEIAEKANAFAEKKAYATRGPASVEDTPPAPAPAAHPKPPKDNSHILKYRSY